jgi:DNA-binding winged helix-turn-helix (wHTH) protein
MLKQPASDNGTPQRVRFDSFQLDLATGELSRSGVRIHLQDQPARLLTLLVEKSGTLVTRTEIQKVLWEDGQFVEFEHAINTAVKKIREVLEDNKDAPRFIETLPRKGYRFIAPVEFVEERRADAPTQAAVPPTPEVASQAADTFSTDFALPLSSNRIRLLFLLTQIPYVATYLTLFYHWDHMDLSEALTRTFDVIPLGVSLFVFRAVALIGFAIRVYLLGLVGWGHPAAAGRYLRIFPVLAVLDAVWAATPLLVQPDVGPAPALAGLVLMAWLVFGQRTVMLSLIGNKS